MKKNYQKPTMTVVKIQQRGFMCSSQMGGHVEPNVPAASRDDDDDWEY